MAEPGLFQILRADYAVLDEMAEIDGRPPENRVKHRVLAPFRFATNPSFRAAMLFRLAARSNLMHWFWRSLLMALHSCEVMRGATIGGGLRLPHPIGITIAHMVVVGERVTISQHVTLGADMTYTAQPRVGDGAFILPGAVVAGGITIGEGALVGANCVVREDVEPGGVVVLTGTEVRQAAPTGSTADPLG